MEINKENAIKLWEQFYGDNILVEDCFGSLMYKYDYNNSVTKREYKELIFNMGWNIDHILPVSKGGTDSDNNLEPIHIKNNLKKGEKTMFSIRNTEYAVYKCKVSVDGHIGYGLIIKSTSERIDSKFKYHKHF